MKTVTWFVGIGSAGVIFLVDQLTKRLWFFPSDEGFFCCRGLLQQVTHKNHGLIANIPVPVSVIIIVTGALLLGLLFWWARISLTASLGEYVGVGVFFGGAMGNLVDRIELGYVRDWILLFGRSAFNVADVAIMCGILLMWFGRERSFIQGRKPPA